MTVDWQVIFAKVNYELSWEKNFFLKIDFET